MSHTHDSARTWRVKEPREEGLFGWRENKTWQLLCLIFLIPRLSNEVQSSRCEQFRFSSKILPERMKTVDWQVPVVPSECTMVFTPRPSFFYMAPWQCLETVVSKMFLPDVPGQPDMADHVSSTSIHELEEGGVLILWGQLELHNEFQAILSQKQWLQQHIIISVEGWIFSSSVSALLGQLSWLHHGL